MYEGLMFRDSVEIDEQKYPIRGQRDSRRIDSEGAGRRRGAPDSKSVMVQNMIRCEPSTSPDGYTFRRAGVRGGGRRSTSLPFHVSVDGEAEAIAPIASTELGAGEVLLHLLSGGGGYGDPLVA